MRAIEIVRTDDGEAGEELLGELVARLAERGRVGAVVARDGSGADSGGGSDHGAETTAGLETARSAGATAAYAVGPDGWDGTGDVGSVADAVDRLAPTCDFGVVDGAGTTRLPTVLVGGVPADDERGSAAGDGRVLATVESPADLDLDELVEEVDHYETLESLVADVKRSADEVYAGAISTFTGRVRAKEGPGDERTERLEFERYDEPAKAGMAEIRAALEAREGVYDVRLHHKTGVVEAGEDIVHVVVLAGHRAEAFAAVEDGINRLKEEVPLFKKEVTEGGEFWAHEGREVDRTK